MSPGVVAKRSISKARRLRKEMSEGEKRLWSQLKAFRNSHGIHVRRQAPIGPYIADFAIHAAKLIIEVDGPAHEELERQERDRARDDWFAKVGYRIMRFRTDEVMNAWSDCVERILREVRQGN